MCEIKIFENAEFGKVRVNTVNNEPMFCLSDVCRVLDIKNPSDAKTRLRKEGVVTAEVSTPIVSQGVDTGKNKTMSMTFINEPNLYKLIFQRMNSEYVNPKDYVTYDGAMKILCMGNNRAGFKKLMDKYGIKNQNFNNHKIGFKRSDILAVKDKLKEERQKKNLKRR